MDRPLPTLKTIGQIVEELGTPIHKIRYVITSRQIEPIARIGPCRVFDELAFERIREELDKIKEGRDVAVVA